MDFLRLLKPSEYGLRAGLVFGLLTGLISAVEIANGESIAVRLLYLAGGSIGGLIFGFEAGAVREAESRLTEWLIDAGLLVVASGMIVLLVIAVI